MIPQPRRLIGHHRVSRRMGLVKGIFCKISHLIKDRLRHILRDPFADTAGYSLFRITEHKVLSLLGHYIALFLRHGTAHQIASSHGIPCQIPHDLHYLFLIHNTAIGRIQDWLQHGCFILYVMGVFFARQIFRNKIHRARTIQRNTRNNIFQILRFQLAHEGGHTGTFQLEYTIGLAGSDHLIHFDIIHINGIDVDLFSFNGFNNIHRILDHRQGTQTQKVHF